jgi:hypothetical protein
MAGITRRVATGQCLKIHQTDKTYEKPTTRSNTSQRGGVLALIVKCPKCQTQRAFKVNDRFMLVVTRQSSGTEYSTVCEECGHRSGVVLAWTQRHPRWVSERLIFTKTVTVEDDYGMTKQEGGKKI